MDKKIWIILAVVLGTFVLLLVLTLSLFFWKRSQKKVRGFSLRAVTPLDDAEFESWRRPSQYTQRPEKKYNPSPAQPAVVRGSPGIPTMFEKELHSYDRPRTPSPQPISHSSPSTPIRKPERVRRKSSVSSSIADRPPTPYSPSSTSGEFPRSSPHIHGHRKSGSSPHIHYPSMSETSAFRFEFEYSPPNSPPREASRPSHQSDRPLHYSYRYGDNV